MPLAVPGVVLKINTSTKSLRWDLPDGEAGCAVDIAAARGWDHLRAPGVAKRVGVLAKILLIVSMVPVLVFALPKSLSLIGDGTLWSLIAFTLVGLIAGHILGGPRPDVQVALALSTACRHPGLVVAMTAVNIPQEHNPTSAILLYLLLSALLTSLYILWQRRRVKNQSTQIASQQPV